MLRVPPSRPEHASTWQERFVAFADLCRISARRTRPLPTSIRMSLPAAYSPFSPTLPFATKEVENMVPPDASQ